MCCERLIGQIKNCLKQKKIKESDDYENDDDIRNTDSSVKGLISLAFYT